MKIYREPDGWRSSGIPSGEAHSVERKRCKKCGGILDIGLNYIVEKLREAGLLRDGFELECCICLYTRYLRFMKKGRFRSNRNENTA